MKKLLTVLGFLPMFALASHNHWTDVNFDQLDSVIESTDIEPDKFRALSLDLSGLASNLNHEIQVNKVAEILLPKPDGAMELYRVSKYNMMAEELQKKYPQLQTFHGYNVTNPKEKIYMDVTHKGLHAMSLGGDSSFWIDPVSKNNSSIYASYFKENYNNSHPDWICDVVGHDHDHESDEISSRGVAPINEMSLKTYRLAVAATTEYTNFHGGSIADGMAAIVTAMVRVNGIYENDLAIRMVLIGNNDLIVYNAEPDPYSNNSGFTMLGQNQSNIDDVIGNANYDIGHVFSTGGGGIAGLGVPCRTGNKAQGVTGLGSPLGDVFWVDYVAHEIGHQWGGSHTFNTEVGSCGFGNRSPNSAYEPGSASTIQGYAGICGSDNIQNNSDPYFHARSLDQMNSYASFGSGANCGTIINNNNDAPTITVLSPANKNIPINTPFELCADATDADTNDNNLTYNWEQYDLGPAGSPNSPSGNAPIFRSFIATSSGCRVFPQWSDILNNTQTKGEILPSYDRSLSFRLTVRDNRLNGGAFNTDEYTLNVEEDSGPFEVTAPNTSITVNAYDSLDVEWNVADTDMAPISCSEVDILMSSNSGSGNYFPVINNTSNDGFVNIEVPNIDSDQVRIRVNCSDNVFFDISDSNFTVIGEDLIFADGFEVGL